jgi:hypothetical protein
MAHKTWTNTHLLGFGITVITIGQLVKKMLGTTSFVDEFLDPNNLFVSSNVEVYPYSIVESIVLSWLELFQLRALSFRIKHVLRNLIHYFSNI